VLILRKPGPTATISGKVPYPSNRQGSGRILSH
jgi:hypothetical protein